MSCSPTSTQKGVPDWERWRLDAPKLDEALLGREEGQHEVLGLQSELEELA